jgi:hypothetical protein
MNLAHINKIHADTNEAVAALATITNAGETDERVWDKPVAYRTQKSIDRVLEYFIRNGRLLSIEAQGDVMSIVTKIITDTKAQTPSYLSHDVDEMMNYLIAWLCDYCEDTNMHYMDLTFSLKKKQGDVS